MIGPDVMLERVDAEALKEGEEFTMMRWGNAKVLSIQRDEAGKVSLPDLSGLRDDRAPVAIVAERRGDLAFLPWGGWAASPANHEVTVVEYDDLLTKKTLEENDNFEDFLTSKDHPTKIEVGV